MTHHAERAEEHAESAGQALAQFHNSLDELAEDLDEEEALVLRAVRSGVTAVVEVELSIANRLADL